MRISDWSSDVCSSDLQGRRRAERNSGQGALPAAAGRLQDPEAGRLCGGTAEDRVRKGPARRIDTGDMMTTLDPSVLELDYAAERSEEHTSELQSLMRNSYAVFCLKNKTSNMHKTGNIYHT